MKKQEIIEMFHRVDYVPKTHIQSLDLLDKYCVKRGYELIKEGYWAKPINH